MLFTGDLNDVLDEDAVREAEEVDVLEGTVEPATTISYGYREFTLKHPEQFEIAEINRSMYLQILN